MVIVRGYLWAVVNIDNCIYVRVKQISETDRSVIRI